MTNPCEYGLRCPYRLNDECDAYCTYPKLAEDADEGEEYPDVRDTECDDVSPLLARILDAFAHDAEARRCICSILAEYETKEAELSRLDDLRTDEYGRGGE